MLSATLRTYELQFLKVFPGAIQLCSKKGEAGGERLGMTIGTVCARVNILSEA